MVFVAKNIVKKRAEYITNPFFFPWVLALLFYGLEYAVRSAPSIMIDDLVQNYNVSTTSVSMVIGAYYITYSITSLAAGLFIDRIGAKIPLFVGILILTGGCLLFIVPHYLSGYIGRLLQGMGSAIAFPAVVYLAVKSFPSKYLATAIGIAQTAGMLGGSAGQQFSFSYLNSGLSFNSLWILFAFLAFVLAVLLMLITPKDTISVAPSTKKQGLLSNYKIVFSNPQSILCGLITGLLFAPTTIFAMIWGVNILEKSRGFSQETATIACALVPIGWAIGCPLLGWIADKYQKRISVLAGGAVLMIMCLIQLAYLPSLLPVEFTFVLLGIGSGSAMLPYSTIKEVNPDHVKGSATGAINFMTFGVTTLLAPLFTSLFATRIQTASLLNKEELMAHSCLFFVAGIGLAIFLSTFLQETRTDKK